MATVKFGRYEIKSEVGRGGMATVFHAYDPRFERDVALKVLPREFLHDPQFRTRFEREAKMIALLEHPAIVPVYDFGEEEGQPYIVMRYMSGGSMADRLARGAMSIEETLQLFNRLSPALDAAHRRGIVHRDLKPGNILFDQYGNAFLSDFGIARLSQAGVATLTGGNILGTPAYMSPEQVQGEKEIDGRSDIYSMGIIFYQMVTGQAPYQATTPARVMMMHLLEPVPQILQAKQDLPVSLQKVMDKAMAKDPADRYATMAEMSSALSEIFTTATPSGSGSYATVVASPATRSAAAGRTRLGKPAPQTAVGQQPAAAQPAKRFPIFRWIIVGLLAVGLVAGIGLGVWYLASSGIFARSTPTEIPVVLVVSTATPTDKPIEPTSTPEIPTETPPPPLPTDTLIPTSTEPPPATHTPTETETPAPTIVAAVTIGGADKIAFINKNDLWMVNPDGSDLQQITNDGAAKDRPQWLPDGKNIVFLTGKCIKMVNVLTLRVDLITCFETAEALEAFEVSPDGKQVAISLDYEQLYVVPFDLEALKQVKYRTDLAPMGLCKEFSPFSEAFVKSVRWSKDSQKVAFVFSAPVGGRREDNIRVVDITVCSEPELRIGVDFPASFFTISGYGQNPVLGNFGWDGLTMFALNGSIRNDGFGDLYLFNLETNRVNAQVNPVDKSCCYRDPQFSPDGRYLVFAYQAYSQDNTIRLYYVPIGTFGTGEKYSPIPLPDGFFPNRTDSPQPALRPSP